MLHGKRFLAVVPARGGSKGVKLKNLHPLRGKPLLLHTVELIRSCPWLDRTVVSTDSEQIAAVAETAGLAAPFRRPEALSGDRIGDWDVLRHALVEMEAKDGHPYDFVLMLQPTCPLREADQVAQTAVKAALEGWDAVWTVSPTDLKYHPLKALSVSPDGRLGYFDPRSSGIVARQQLAPVYHRNGAAYVISRECLLGQCTILGQRSACVVIEQPMVSIDTLEDFARVESIMARCGG